MITNEEFEEIRELGSKVTGAILGGTIALSVGSLGVILGSTVALVTSKVINDLTSRVLSKKESERLNNATAYIALGLKDRLNSGIKIRQDSFFKKRNKYNSSAEELCEGILIKCKHQYQEKKIKYISNIFAETVFDSKISSEIANSFLLTAEKFSYQQYCIISFFAQKDVLFNSGELLPYPYMMYPQAKFSLELETLKKNIYDMIQHSIINSHDLVMTNSHYVTPKELTLTEFGLKLYDTMRLEQIPKTDLELIFKKLRYKKEFGKVSFHFS